MFARDILADGVRHWVGQRQEGWAIRGSGSGQRAVVGVPCKDGKLRRTPEIHRAA
jgi:hypothetical protein